MAQNFRTSSTVFQFFLEISCFIPKDLVKYLIALIFDIDFFFIYALLEKGELRLLFIKVLCTTLQIYGLI